MKEIRYFYVPDAATADVLPDEESVHALRVLRLQPGDPIMLIDGQGSFFEAEVTGTASHRCHYAVCRQLPQQPLWTGHLHIAIAPTKMMDRMEWMAEKATEIGISQLSFLDCQFSERRTLKLPRLEKIVVAAMKQSRKAWKPQLDPMQDFQHFLEAHSTGRRYIAHCYEEVPRTNLFDELRRTASGEVASDHDADALVLIGPEGDFSIREVEAAVRAGFVSVDLGQSRLRTETAALAALMMMHLAQKTT